MDKKTESKYVKKVKNPEEDYKKKLYDKAINKYSSKVFTKKMKQK